MFFFSRHSVILSHIYSTSLTVASVDNSGRLGVGVYMHGRVRGVFFCFFFFLHLRMCVYFYTTRVRVCVNKPECVPLVVFVSNGPEFVCNEILTRG